MPNKTMMNKEGPKTGRGPYQLTNFRGNAEFAVLVPELPELRINVSISKAKHA